MDIDLDVIIVTYNSAAVIGQLLESIPAALDGLRFEVVVVDNGSTDDTVALVSAQPGCRLVRSANVGYAAGINRGVREATVAGAILVLNPDTRLAAGSIPPLMHALRDPAVGIVAPQVRSPGGMLALSLRREPTLMRSLGLSRSRFPRLSEYINCPADYIEPLIVDWALGAALLVSRACYDRLGGWDETYFLYSEETDFCLRARDAGFLTRYEPASVIMHIGGESGRDGRTHIMQIVNRIRLYRRRHGYIASWGYFWLTIASQFSWLIRGRRDCGRAIAAILRPSLRPRELNCSHTLMPR
jgi:N-acetylglucosaminyl-diphospho-decaprenol L-rhamnosyltransferase